MTLSSNYVALHSLISVLFTCTFSALHHQKWGEYNAPLFWKPLQAVHTRFWTLHQVVACGDCNWNWFKKFRLIWKKGLLVRGISLFSLGIVIWGFQPQEYNPAQRHRLSLCMWPFPLRCSNRGRSPHYPGSFFNEQLMVVLGHDLDTCRGHRYSVFCNFYFF